MPAYLRAEILFTVQHLLLPFFRRILKLDKLYLFAVPIIFAITVIWYSKLPTVDDVYLWSILMLVLFSQYVASRIFIRYIDWELQKDK